MRLGAYRQQVHFQRRAVTSDPVTGADSYTWQTVVLGATPLEKVPAEVLTGPGREFNAADAKQAETAARVNLHWFPGLDPAWRMLWDGRAYDIQSIETDATGRREYRLRCKEGVNDGA